jgi:hypothetical protein
MPSSNSNIARRPGLIFGCVNLGIPAALAWQYFETGLSLDIVLVSGLVSLILFNALLLFMYRRAKAAERD